MILIGIVIIGLVYLFVFRSPHSKNGDLAPDFKTTLIDGSNFKLSDLRGQYVLLDFWGSWCPPCRRDNPNLVSLHKKYGDKTFKTIGTIQTLIDKTASGTKRYFDTKQDVKSLLGKSEDGVDTLFHVPNDFGGGTHTQTKSKNEDENN